VDILNDLGSSMSLDETLSLLAARLKHMIPHDAAAIYTLKKDKLVLQYFGGEESLPSTSLEIPIGQGLSGWVAENHRPIVNGNPAVEPAYVSRPGKVKPMLSALSVPLEGLGGVAGVLTLYGAAPDAFTRDHLRLLMAISSKAGLAIENALQFRQVESSAVTDELTSLGNARALFLQLDSELALAKRAQVSLAVLVLDLDGFRQINERLGHLTGNRALQHVAKGLRASCREYDFVARMGGDEFVILLPGCSPGAARIKETSFQTITRDAGWSVCGEDLLSASVGEASYPADWLRCRDPARGCRQADVHDQALAACRGTHGAPG
jgi:diguanylate cyclase (GGDEF)-like protein